MSVLPVVSKPGLAGLLEACLTGFADVLAAALVFIERSDVADPGVQPHPILVQLKPVEFGAQHRRFGDGEQMWPFWALSGREVVVCS